MRDRAMIKKIVSLGAMLLVVSAVAVANATLYTIENSVTSFEDGGYLTGSFDSLSYAHNFTFDPVAESINSASLVLSFSDDEGDECFFDAEIGIIFDESGVIGIEEIDTGDYEYDVNLSSLGDETLEVTVFSFYGDFTLNKSVLTISYTGDEDTANTSDSAPAPVPEPSTVLLIGIGLLSLVGVNRKRFIKKD